MHSKIMYVELKTGYLHNGPAWIGRVMLSKEGQTAYFNQREFCKARSWRANYCDIETGEEYWISEVKKKGRDRHAAGFGKINIDEKVVAEYLRMTKQKALDRKKFKEVIILDIFPGERHFRSNSQTDGLGAALGL